MERNLGRKKILLVDDSKLQLAAIKGMLMEDYEVSIATSGKNALVMLVKNFVPDLILLDIIMPQMDGWETFKAIKGIPFLHDIPIAFMTSKFDLSKVEHARQIGAVDYFKKPSNKYAMVNKVEIIFSRLQAPSAADAEGAYTLNGGSWSGPDTP